MAYYAAKNGHWSNEKKITQLSNGWSPANLIWIQLFCVCWMDNSFTSVVKSKPVKQEVGSTVILPHWSSVFSASGFKRCRISRVPYSLNHCHLPITVKCDGAVWPDLAIYWTLGNFSNPFETMNLPKFPIFLGNFCNSIKIFNFYSEIILGNFYRHLQLFTGHTTCVGRVRKMHWIRKLSTLLHFTHQIMMVWMRLNKK